MSIAPAPLSDASRITPRRDPLWHTATLLLLYALSAVVLILIVNTAAHYYGLPLKERPHDKLHDVWKPSGVVGHGLGIVGSAMMLTLLLYSLRKRARSMQQAGNIRYWLNYHIWLGVTGPLLVLFHTAFKFGGIVSISFWSMMAVALSGVLGRYIYLQIPRTLSGHELSARELEEMDRDLFEQLARSHGLNDALLASIHKLTVPDTSSGLIAWILSDLGRPFRFRRLRVLLRHSGSFSSREIRNIIRIARQRAVLQRRAAFLERARLLLHHWHVFHKPFAIVMLVIMVVHVVVTVLFGYRWIFS